MSTTQSLQSAQKSRLEKEKSLLWKTKSPKVQNSHRVRKRVPRLLINPFHYMRSGSSLQNQREQHLQMEERNEKKSGSWKKDRQYGFGRESNRLCEGVDCWRRPFLKKTNPNDGKEDFWWSQLQGKQRLVRAILQQEPWDLQQVLQLPQQMILPRVNLNYVSSVN